MRSMRTDLVACGLGACLLATVAVGAGQEPDPAASAPADVVRSQLTLNLRAVAVSFDPALGAGDPDHRELLVTSGPASDTRVRVGEIEVMPRLRIGTLDGTAPGGSESPSAGTTTYVLLLARSGAGWSLDLQATSGGDEGDPATTAEHDDAAHEHEHDDAEHDDPGHDLAGHQHHDASEARRSRDGVGRVPLTRQAAGVRETFSATLVPTADDAGQLVLRWHDHLWTADFHFAEPPEPDEEEPDDQESGGQDEADAAEAEPEPEGEDDESEEDEGPRVANDRESLRFDSDTSTASRFLRLSERHETAVDLPDDSRIAVLFWQEQSVDHADFAAMEALDDGEVVRLTQAAVIRLRSEVPLRFGGVAIPTGNLAPGFPGSYGLWLKRSGDGWRLVFNHEADSWGTQHDPAFDAAEIDVAYSQDGLATRPLGAALLPATAHAGRLVIHWGAHEWAADFTIPE